jgi:hypothetical protein
VGFALSTAWRNHPQNPIFFFCAVLPAISYAFCKTALNKFFYNTSEVHTLKLCIRNFGPIKDAKIETKPFTLIIGKNNQGKSYSAELVFSLMQLCKILPYPGFSIDVTEKNTISIRLVWSHILEAPYRTRRLDSRSTIDLKLTDFEELANKELTAKIIKETVLALSSFLERYLPFLLEERFGMKIGSLVNTNSSSAKITFDLSEFLSVCITMFRDGKTTVEGICIEENLPKLIISMQPYVERLRKQLPSMFDVYKRNRERHPPVALLDTISDLIERLTASRRKAHILPSLEPFPNIIYIPAGRAGLLEGYYSVASAYFSLATVALQRGISMPAMPPTASVFYNLLMEFAGKPGKMSSVASELATEVLHGEIVLEPDKKQPALKRITYKPFSKDQRTVAIDVIHAGSMVKELAGLYLAIREKIIPGTQLIVEEPEAHLHPSAQKRLARILMKLAAKGVIITITTHSDVILREVAHLVGHYKEKRVEVLSPMQVAVILLKEDEGGSTSEELKIPPSGILEGLPTFDEVIMELYEEEVKLESRTSVE